MMNMNISLIIIIFLFFIGKYYILLLFNFILVYHLVNLIQNKIIKFKKNILFSKEMKYY